MSSNSSYLDQPAMPIQRQSQNPSPSQQQHQMNGVGTHNPAGMPNGNQHAGQQADINYLWGVVQELSEILAHNRAQTASIINGVQRIQARAAQEGNGPTLEQINGELNVSTNSQLAELYAANQTLRSQNATLEQELKDTEDLKDAYETAMQKAMEKIRPFAHAHEENRLALIKHFNTLLQDERNANLELRLEHSKWQEGLQRANKCARMALNARVDEDNATLRKMAWLRRENRVLRRLVGWDIEPDSDDEDERREEEERRIREEEEERAREPDLMGPDGGLDDVGPR